jgi:hypothetical protein
MNMILRLIQTRLGRLAAIIGSIGVVFGFMTGVWQIADKLEIRPALSGELHLVQTTEQQTIQALSLFRFQYLMERLRQNGILSDLEMAELCQLSHQLNYVKIEQCR